MATRFELTIHDGTRRVLVDEVAIGFAGSPDEVAAEALAIFGKRLIREAKHMLREAESDHINNLLDHASG
jgi:hypothetical protein